MFAGLPNHSALLTSTMYLKRNFRYQHKLSKVPFVCQWLNRPFPSSLVPLFQSESKCETILMKMTLICMEKKRCVELIFIWKARLALKQRHKRTRKCPITVTQNSHWQQKACRTGLAAKHERAIEEHGHERQAFDTRWAGERANTRCKLTISLATHFNLKFCLQCASSVVLVLAASRYSYKVMRGLRLVDCP